MNKWEVRDLSMRSEKKPDQLSRLKLAFKRPANFLRHADIQVTSMHYADHKERVVVDIGALLEPENVTPISEAAEGAKETICPPPFATRYDKP